MTTMPFTAPIPVSSSSTAAELIAALAGIRQPPKQRFAWVEQAELPPVVVDQAALDPRQVIALLEVLRLSSLETPHPAVALVREHAEPASLRAFLWRLIGYWETKRAPGSWVFEAPGLFGDDTLVEELIPRITTWRAQGNYARVRLALRCLATMGFHAALRTLESFAKQDRYKSLQDGALAHLEAIATAHGLTRRQLEDRSVPRFGIGDPHPAFQIGEHTVYIALNGDLVPVIQDQLGKLLRSFPKPKHGNPSADDLHAWERWKARRKLITQEMRAQSARFEQAMVDQYQWDTADWHAAILGHPLLAALARRVLWAGYNRHGQLQDVFCYGEGMSASNEHYATVDPYTYASIGIPHPASVALERRVVWGELMHNFQIMTPFPQLNRPVYDPTIAAPGVTKLAMFAANRLKEGSFRILHRKAWRSGGHTQYESTYTMYSLRPFEGAAITAVAAIRSEVGHGYRRTERCDECFFVDGLIQKYTPEEGHALLELQVVPPVVFSETVADWTALVNNPAHQYEG